MLYSNDEITKYTAIYSQFSKAVYNYSLRMTSDRLFSEDLVQTVFLKLYSQWDTIQNRESIKYWLFTVARNEVYLFFREKKTHLDSFNVLDIDEVEVEDTTTPESDFEYEEFRENLMIQLETLGRENKEIFLLREYGVLSYREIAQATGLTEEVVKARLFRIRNKVIKVLKNFYKK